MFPFARRVRPLALRRLASSHLQTLPTIGRAFSSAADVMPQPGQRFTIDGPPEGKGYYPIEYAVKLPDLTEKEMKEISRRLGAEYLSVAPYPRQHSYPPEGVLHVPLYRLCVNLVCRWDPLKGGFGKPINVLFVIDTTAVWSYLSKKAMAALLEKPIDSDALPSNLTVRIEDHLGKEHLIECAPSFGDFEHINILGTQAMGRLGWSPVVVEWGDWGMFIMAPVSIGKVRWWPGVWAQIDSGKWSWQLDSQRESQALMMCVSYGVRLLH